MFYLTAIVPALVTLAVLAVWALNSGKHYWVFCFAALGCLIAAAAPWFSTWYAKAVLNDNTANIGAGMLALGQPLIAPAGALLGALVGAIVEVTVIRPAVDRLPAAKPLALRPAALSVRPWLERAQPVGKRTSRETLWHRAARESWDRNGR